MAGLSPKPDYIPLLEAGRHEMSLTDIRRMCVDGFPTSISRREIMDQLEQMFAALRQHNVPCDVWLDGSFMTRKISPGDVDLVVWVPADFADNCNAEQRGVLDDLSKNLKHSGKCARCDTYLCPIAEQDHPLYRAMKEAFEYWTRWFGHSRGGTPKGMATVHMGDPT